WTYTHPNPGTSRPHALTTVTATGPLAATPTRTFTYDNAGNTSTRHTETGTAQQLTWNAEGRLNTLTEGTDQTTYIYDADGNRIIQRAPNKTTLYLGATELTLASGGSQPDGTRYYSAAGRTIAVRTLTGLVWSGSDHHGTEQVQINADDLTTSRKRRLPYGEDRTTPPSIFLGTRGFVGGTQDDTGLTHLGAREYDPTTGRFISVDPIQDLTDPQQWNGYSYANNNPTTFSDPTGNIWTDFLVGSDPHFNGPGAGTKSYGPVGTGATSKTRETNHCANGSPYSCQAAADKKAYASAKIKTKPHQELGFVGQLLTDVTCTVMVICRLADTGVGIATIVTAVYHGDFAAAGDGALGFLPGCTRKCGDYAGDTYNWLQGKRGKRSAGACIVPSTGNSFAHGTEVVMADRTTKPIEEVKIGEWVLATDPETSETYPRQVTATHINHDTELADITVKLPGGGTATINTTQHHKFWSETRTTWIDGGALTAGEDLLSLHRHAVPVVAVKAYGGVATMYDLTVDQTHTYYVLVGETPVLVHNSNCDVSDLASKIDIENISMTKTVENHTWDIAGTRDVDAPNFGKAARPYMNGNNRLLLREIMEGSAPRMDSRGAPGVVEWRTPGAMNGSNGIWELNIDANSNRIVHFVFKSTKG
ncbi:hypothetical protein C1A38_02285, partial [Verrucosispora sp. ts21]|uniref:RHS repeat-associated core domain-containing protein n=1 Tax=Verrucosispora sp. ts21 TaxID=2069341 RepID=UPI000CB38873